MLWEVKASLSDLQAINKCMSAGMLVNYVRVRGKVCNRHAEKEWKCWRTRRKMWAKKQTNTSSSVSCRRRRKKIESLAQWKNIVRAKYTIICYNMHIHLPIYAVILAIVLKLPRCSLSLSIMPTDLNGSFARTLAGWLANSSSVPYHNSIFFSLLDMWMCVCIWFSPMDIYVCRYRSFVERTRIQLSFYYTISICNKQQR